MSKFIHLASIMTHDALYSARVIIVYCLNASKPSQSNNIRVNNIIPAKCS